MLKVNEINEINRLFELRHEWNDVLERSRDNHVYLTWEWQSAYWKHFGKERKLRILCITDTNEIIAIAPLRQSRYSFANLFGYNVIEPLGCWGSMGHGADYTGLILAEREAKCLKLFLNYLTKHDDWDFIYLYDIPGTSILPELLSKMPESCPVFELAEGAICPYISIPDSVDVFMKGLTPDFRYNLRRYMRKIKRDYGKVELKEYDKLGSIEEAVKIFMELHQKAWESKGMPGVYHAQKNRNFFLDVSKAFARKGWLALYFLTANDEPIAGLYCFEYKQKMLGCLSGFDPDYFKYSVGNLIIAKVVEKCIQRKIEEFDFLKGNEPYKFKYTATYRRNLNIRFVNKRITSNLYDWGIRTAKRTKMEKILHACMH